LKVVFKMYFLYRIYYILLCEWFQCYLRFMCHKSCVSTRENFDRLTLSFFQTFLISGYCKLKFPEILIWVLGTIISGFWFSIIPVPTRSPEPKVQIFGFWESNIPDRKIGISLPVPGTYNQIPRYY